MRKVYIFIVLLLFVVFIFQTGPTLAAANFFDGLKNTGSNAGYPDTAQKPENFLARMMGTFLAPVFMGVIGMLLFFYGGYNIMMSRGNEEMVTKGKNIIINTAIAMIIAFSAYAIIKLILPLWKFVTT
jgi:hypothetical protein